MKHCWKCQVDFDYKTGHVCLTEKLDRIIELLEKLAAPVSEENK